MDNNKASMKWSFVNTHGRDGLRGEPKTMFQLFIKKAQILSLEDNVVRGSLT